MAKDPWMGSVAQLKMWCSVMSSLDGSLSTQRRNLVKPLTSFVLLSPRYFKGPMPYLVNQSILRKHQSSRSFKDSQLKAIKSNRNWGSKIDFFFLSNSKEPCFTQIYTTKKHCGHVDGDFDSLAHFRSTCAYCMGKHMDVDETKAWLRCPVWVQWFHNACFFEK